MFTWATRLNHIQKNKSLTQGQNIKSFNRQPRLVESNTVPANHIEKSEKTLSDNTSTLPNNPEAIFKKKKKRLPGEKLIKEYIQKYKSENISNMQYGGCSTDCKQQGQGLDLAGSGYQYGNGLELAGSGVDLAGSGLHLAGGSKKKRIIKVKQRGPENMTEPQERPVDMKNKKMIALSTALGDILKTLADTLVNSYFRSFKGMSKQEIAITKHEIKNQLYRNMRVLELPTTKKDTKDYAIEIANIVAKTLNVGPAAEDQLLTKVEQGLKRLFGRIYRGQEQTGIGIGKKIRGLANRAAKGFQSEAHNIVNACLGDPANCQSHVQDRTQHHLSTIQKIGKTIRKVGETALHFGEEALPALALAAL